MKSAEEIQENSKEDVGHAEDSDIDLNNSKGKETLFSAMLSYYLLYR